MKRHSVFFMQVFALALLAGCGTPLHRDDAAQGAFEAGHHLLAANEPEQPGYGLYSYLLFASVPTDANRDHYLQAIAAIITIPDVGELVEAGFLARELNITSIPVRMPLHDGEKGLSQQNVARMSEWILEYYDYARARYLLKRLPGTHESGPYLLSTFSPLEGEDGTVESFLRQDFSRVPDSRAGLTYAWVREFLERANQPRLWDEWTMKMFVQKLRLAIAVLGENVPPVINAMETLIKWTHVGTNNKAG
ncbi:MAG: hypothetical protein U9P00_11025 [Pseudomonadota bacterium]|nr:hypothetical protein [Pseudomonadota bacterium]